MHVCLCGIDSGPQHLCYSIVILLSRWSGKHDIHKGAQVPYMTCYVCIVPAAHVSCMVHSRLIIASNT
jgi:hypothetical protein